MCVGRRLDTGLSFSVAFLSVSSSRIVTFLESLACGRVSGATGVRDGHADAARHWLAARNLSRPDSMGLGPKRSGFRSRFDSDNVDRSELWIQSGLDSCNRTVYNLNALSVPWASPFEAGASA